MSEEVVGHCDELDTDVRDCNTKDWAGTCYAWSPDETQAKKVSFEQDIRCEHCTHFHKKEEKPKFQWLFDAGMRGIVSGVLIRHYKLTCGEGCEYQYLGGFLTQKQYLTLRRGVRSVMTRAGHDPKTMTDEMLLHILKELQFTKVGDRDLTKLKPKMEFQKRWYIGNQLGCEAKGCTKIAVWEWKGKESPYMAQLCDEHYHELKEARST